MSQTWKPRVPKSEEVMRLTAYAKPGWVAVYVVYKEGAVVHPRRFYLPIQRAPYKMEVHTERTWKSREYVEPWLAAIREYVDDVAAVLDFAASKTVEKLREFNVVVKARESGLVEGVGIDLGDRVVEIGTPPELLYTIPVERIGGGWAVPGNGEYIRTLVYTAMWKSAVEAVGCRVWYRRGGAARVECGGSEMYADRPVLPLDEVQEVGHRITDGLIDALLEGP